MEKFAIVTGGTKGIGRGIVLSLLHQGYSVIATYANDARGAKEFKSSVKKFSERLSVFACDQSVPAEVYALIDFIKTQTDAVSCIVCNAGATVRKTFENITDDEWCKVMQVSVNSNFILIRELKSMILPQSRIIFIGSLMGVYPHATSLPYGVSKAATHALAINLVKEFENTGTTVNVVVPGFVETEWQKEKPAHIRENIYNKTAIHRFAEVDEIVSAVDFIISNAFVNGSMLEVSGGYCYK